MSRPRFLANHDLTEAIIVGVLRREPALEFLRLREFGLDATPDPQVLAYAHEHGFLLVSHDVNTMTRHAAERIGAGLLMPGVLVCHQGDRIGAIIDDLIMIWAASEAEEWTNQVIFLPM
jgi:uncharacterized protein DUF5615